MDALNERAVGTGPFKVTAWKRGDSMRFERNESYWGNPPLFKKMRFQVILEAGARLAALRAGQVGFVDAVPPLDAQVLVRESGIKVVSSVQKLYCRVYLNARPKDAYDSGGKDGLFLDPRIRLALNYAIQQGRHHPEDLPRLRRRQRLPVSTVSYGYAPQEPYAYDPKRARAILAKAAGRIGATACSRRMGRR